MSKNPYRLKTTIKATNYNDYYMNDRYGYDYQYMRNMLQMGQGPNMPYSEIGLMAGVAKTDWSWSPLFVDAFLLIMFFSLIFVETYKILKDKKKGVAGSETSLRYIIFFSTTTLLPSVLIAIFSLILFTVGLERYFDKQIKSVVNNSTEVARNYLTQTRNSIEADILLMLIDINSKAGLFYDNPKKFLNLLK